MTIAKAHKTKEEEKKLFGKYSGGKGDLSTRRKQYLKEILSEKYGNN